MENLIDVINNQGGFVQSISFMEDPETGGYAITFEYFEARDHSPKIGTMKTTMIICEKDEQYNFIADLQLMSMNILNDALSEARNDNS